MIWYDFIWYTVKYSIKWLCSKNMCHPNGCKKNQYVLPHWDELEVRLEWRWRNVSFRCRGSWWFFLADASRGVFYKNTKLFNSFFSFLDFWDSENFCPICCLKFSNRCKQGEPPPLRNLLMWSVFGAGCRAAIEDGAALEIWHAEPLLMFGCVPKSKLEIYPIGSMYGIFTYIYHKNQLNVGEYTIHGSYGYKIFQCREGCLRFSKASATPCCRRLNRVALDCESWVML